MMNFTHIYLEKKMKKAIIIFISFLVISFNVSAVPPECKKPNAPKECFNRLINVQVNQVSEKKYIEETKAFSDEDWSQSEIVGSLLSQDQNNATAKSCAHLCSKSKQYCNPDDLSPCHGTGGSCRQYCW